LFIHCHTGRPKNSGEMTSESTSARPHTQIYLCVRFFRFFFGVQRRRQQRSAIREPIAAVTAQFAALSPKKNELNFCACDDGSEAESGRKLRFFRGFYIYVLYYVVSFFPLLFYTFFALFCSILHSYFLVLPI